MEYTLFPLNNILPVSMYHNNLKEALCEFELGPFKFAKTRLSDWHRGNALTSHHCDPSLISGISMLDGHMVTTSDRCSPVCYHTETTRTQTSVPTSMINIQVYKFIQITVGHYVHTYTKLRTINKHKISVELKVYTDIDLNYITLRQLMEFIVHFLSLTSIAVGVCYLPVSTFDLWEDIFKRESDILNLSSVVHVR